MNKFVTEKFIIESNIDFKYENKQRSFFKDQVKISIIKQKIDPDCYNCFAENKIDENFVVKFCNEDILLDINKQKILILFKNDYIFVSFNEESETKVNENVLDLILPYLYLRHGFLTLHASAFKYKGRTILITADSGIGKSTLLLYLLKCGASFISDDAVFLKEEKTAYHCFGLDTTPPKLDEATIQLIGLEPIEIIKSENLNEKNYVVLNTNEIFNSQINDIYILLPKKEPVETSFRKDSEDVIDILFRQTVGIWGADKTDRLKILLRWKKAADHLNVYKVEYEKKFDFLDEFKAFLEER